MTRKDPQEPERWLVSSDAPADLRALLEVARREGPSIARRASLGTRLGLSARQALIGAGTKGFAVLTIALAGAAGAGLGLSAGHRAPASIPVAVTQSESPAAARPEPEHSVAPPDPPAAAPEEASSQPPPHAPAKPPSEAALIRSAHDALRTNVRQAKSYLERHRRLYPQGQLAQEREVLLIEVLRLEGHAAEASARAAEFRQKNPDSAHRPVGP